MNELSVEQKNFLHIQKRHRRVVGVSRILILLSFLFIWEFTANTGIIDSFIFSSPSKIALCFWELTADGTIFLHIGVTLYETILSFLLVIGISVLAAILLWFSSKLSEILDPYMVVLNMSVAIFGSIISLYSSFSSVDPEKIKLIYTLQGNRFHAMTKVVLPSSLPAVINIMKVNIGLCLVGVIIGEFLAARNGLGYLIIYSSQVFKMDWLLLGIVLLCIMAMLLYALISLLEKWCSKRY